MSSVAVNMVDQQYYHGKKTDNGCTERVRKLMKQMHEADYGLCLHRARCFTEVYQATEGQPNVIRKALAVSKTLDTLPLAYNEGELIVGLQSSRNKAFPLHPEIETSWIIDEGGLKGLATREFFPYHTTEDEQREFEEKIASYWHTRTTLTRYRHTCPENVQDKLESAPYGRTAFALSIFGSHVHLDWAGILEKGTNYYKEYAQEKLDALDPFNLQDTGKDVFYKGVIMVLEAMERFSHRWADFMREKANLCADEVLKKEYEDIADICDRVPHTSAHTFREALQSLWLVQCAFYNDSTGPELAIGRMDQFMLRYYETDIKKGIATREDLLELLELFFIKLNNDFLFVDHDTAKTLDGNACFQNILVGGCDEYGQDAVNELSYLIIDAVIDAHLLQPAMCVRVNERNPDRFLMKTLDLVAMGMGFPSYFNDRPCIAVTRSYGWTQKEAYDYSCTGCEDIGIGTKYHWGPGSMVNFGFACEMAMNDGILPAGLPGRSPGERFSISTGDPRTFKTFEEYMDAVKVHIKEQVDMIYISAQHIAAAVQVYPLLIQSTFQNACLDRGLPDHSGGILTTTFPGINGVGMADVADHCVAVKKLVFDDKTISMDTLCKALAANFEGYEDIRQMCLACPKYGNDDDYVDKIEQEVIDFFASYVDSKPGVYSKYDPDQDTAVVRHKCGISTSPTSSNVPYGKMVGALASGRKFGEPLGDAASAYMGMDTHGPTAAIKSYGKVDNNVIVGGSTVNMYIQRKNLETPEAKKKVLALLRSAFAMDIEHFQFNVMDKEVLLDAQKHPERYPTLMIRVAGYSAYFVELNRSVQDVIIARTQHDVG